MTPDEKLQKWGPGPWVDEPDRVEFYAHGLPCLMRRVEQLGHWCGYVAVPLGHPLHGVDFNKVENIDAHGGLTYSEKCQGTVCHLPKAGESDDVWWLGFDCGHAWDIMPWMQRDLGADAARLLGDSEYRDEAYVRAECEALAKQLAERV